MFITENNKKTSYLLDICNRPDQWTSTTKDGKLSAQFEHTLLVTETGVEILT